MTVNSGDKCRWNYGSSWNNRYCKHGRVAWWTMVEKRPRPQYMACKAVGGILSRALPAPQSATLAAGCQDSVQCQTDQHRARQSWRHRPARVLVVLISSSGCSGSGCRLASAHLVAIAVAISRVSWERQPQPRYYSARIVKPERLCTIRRSRRDGIPLRVLFRPLFGVDDGWLGGGGFWTDGVPEARCHRRPRPRWNRPRGSSGRAGETGVGTARCLRPLWCTASVRWQRYKVCLRAPCAKLIRRGRLSVRPGRSHTWFLSREADALGPCVVFGEARHSCSAVGEDAVVAARLARKHLPPANARDASQARHR